MLSDPSNLDRQIPTRMTAKFHVLCPVKIVRTMIYMITMIVMTIFPICIVRQKSISTPSCAPLAGTFTIRKDSSLELFEREYKQVIPICEPINGRNENGY
jgi:hypothetical protein